MLRARVWGPPELRKVFLVPGSASQVRKDARGLAGHAASVHAVGCGSRRSEALSPPSRPEQGLPTSADSPLPSHPSGRVPPAPQSPGAQAFGGSSHLLHMQPGQWLWVWRSREGEARDWTSVYSCSPWFRERTGLCQGLTECPTHGQMESGRENRGRKARPIPPRTPA